MIILRRLLFHGYGGGWEYIHSLTNDLGAFCAKLAFIRNSCILLRMHYNGIKKRDVLRQKSSALVRVSA